MTSNTPISPRSMPAGLTAAAVVPALAKADLNLAASVADQTAERPRAILMWLDTVPTWRGPGLYEVDYLEGPRIVFIEHVPIQTEHNEHWFRGSERLGDRAQGGTWSLPEKSLAQINIRKVGDIADADGWL